MHKLTRPESPDVLRENAAHWTESYLRRRCEDSAARFYWPNHKENYPPIRKRLGEMTQDHCAFCDGPLGTESRETVEHFQPKSKFPELAYFWKNLFPCCDVCQSNKLEYFHELLLKPDEDEYVFERYFWVDYKTGEISALPNADEVTLERVRITCETYGLNLPVRKKARLRELKFFLSTNNPVLDEFNYRFFLQI